MLTAKQTLKWVTRTPTPPWGIGELRSAFKGDPKQAFSLKQAINGVQNEKCVTFVGVRDGALLTSAATFAQFQAKWTSSQPSKATLNSFATMLSAQGITARYLSVDWRTMALVCAPQKS